MTPRKHSIYIGCPAYGGNGGTSNLHPGVARWLVMLYHQLRNDARIDGIYLDFEADTPCTMVRNAYVEKAREAGCDLLLMVDSDQDPSMYEDEPWFKPFWNVAFDKIYEHHETGPLVIGAPYCGTPGAGENCYVFFWENQGIRGSETSFSIDAYPRAIAAQMSGLQPVAALPTGLILFDMRIFDLLDKNRKSREQVLEEFKDNKISKTEALRCIQDGYFYYEWKDRTASEKASTEDVSATRDMSLAGRMVLGYETVLCAWDSWIGHAKPYMVGKPKQFTVEQIGGVMKRVVLDDVSSRDKIVRVENKALLQALKESNGTPTA